MSDGHHTRSRVAIGPKPWKCELCGATSGLIESGGRIECFTIPGCQERQQAHATPDPETCTFQPDCPCGGFPCDIGHQSPDRAAKLCYHQHQHVGPDYDGPFVAGYPQQTKRWCKDCGASVTATYGFALPELAPTPVGGDE